MKKSTICCRSVLLFAASLTAQTERLELLLFGKQYTGERMIMVITLCLWLKCSV